VPGQGSTFWFTGRFGKQLTPALELSTEVVGLENLRALIVDLLEYSRVERQDVEGTATDGEAVLEQAVRDLRLTIAESGAIVTHDPLPTVVTVPGQLKQVLENLISNAVKFRGPAPPRIHLAAQRQGTEWVFSVRDNGIGLDPQYADRIFVVFQRLHTRSEYAGTGITTAPGPDSTSSRNRTPAVTSTTGSTSPGSTSWS